jgi:hypothetical protein
LPILGHWWQELNHKEVYLVPAILGSLALWALAADLAKVVVNGRTTNEQGGFHKVSWRLRGHPVMHQFKRLLELGWGSRRQESTVSKERGLYADASTAVERFAVRLRERIRLARCQKGVTRDGHQ